MRYVPIYWEKFSASSSAIEIIELAICSIDYSDPTLIQFKRRYKTRGANLYIMENTFNECTYTQGINLSCVFLYVPDI